ncbi:hypothetical protein EJB05_05028, partial [Eragrostis curvula]
MLSGGGDEEVPDGIGMARLQWSRLPTTEAEGTSTSAAGDDELFSGLAVESLDYEVIENYAYREEQAQRSKFWVPYYIMLKWLFSLLIGVGTGLAAIFINLAVENFSGWKYAATFAIIKHSYFVGFVVYTLFNLALVFSSVYIVTNFAPAAAGSGIPEIKGYLNGVDTHGILLFRTLVGKIFGSIGSVGGGLALGKEGPLVHTGACIASLLGQGGSAKYHLSSRWVRIFESDRDRRDLVTCGCAAGVAAAFRAPVGGVLFALEEVTSWWRSHLMWRVFFTSAVVAVVVRSAMNWCNSGKCGHFGAGGFIIWDISGKITLTRKCFRWRLSVLLVDFLEHYLIKLTLYITKWRRTYLHKKGKRVKIFEACLISLVTSTISFVLPLMRRCSPCPEVDANSGIECPRPPGTDGNFVNFYCSRDKEYNDLATIFFNTQVKYNCREPLALLAIDVRRVGVQQHVRQLHRPGPVLELGILVHLHDPALDLHQPAAEHLERLDRPRVRRPALRLVAWPRYLVSEACLERTSMSEMPRMA